MSSSDHADRVHLARELGMHPIAGAAPEFDGLEEGEHYDVVAYTDWCDLFVPTVVRWDGEDDVDDLTDPDRSRGAARRALGDEAEVRTDGGRDTHRDGYRSPDEPFERAVAQARDELERYIETHQLPTGEYTGPPLIWYVWQWLDEALDEYGGGSDDTPDARTDGGRALWDDMELDDSVGQLGIVLESMFDVNSPTDHYQFRAAVDAASRTVARLVPREQTTRTDGGSKYREGYRSPDFRERNREALDMAAQRRRTRLVNGDRLGRGL